MAKPATASYTSELYNDETMSEQYSQGNNVCCPNQAHSQAQNAVCPPAGPAHWLCVTTKAKLHRCRQSAPSAPTQQHAGITAKPVAQQQRHSCRIRLPQRPLQHLPPGLCGCFTHIAHVTSCKHSCRCPTQQVLSHPHGQLLNIGCHCRSYRCLSTELLLQQLLLLNHSRCSHRSNMSHQQR